MKAAVLYASGSPLVIEDVRIASPGPHEVRIRTAAVGVCHSDLSIVEGKLPMRLPIILGHEAAGVVEDVGSDVRTVKVGDHVITCLSFFCGHCEPCLTGHMSICANPQESTRGKGNPPRLEPPPGKTDRINQAFGLSAFAEQMLVHERTCVAIRKDMPLDRAALIGCAVTTGFGAVTHTARIEAGSSVAIVGCGGVGLSTINSAAIAGASRIFAIDRGESKREIALAMGATDFIDAAAVDAAQAVVEATRGGVHYSFEAIGLKRTVEQTFAMLRQGGTATMIGMPPIGTKIEVDSAHLFYERKLQGSMMGSNRFPIDIPRLIELYMQGRLRLDELISRRIKLEQINEALDELKAGQLARSVIEFA
jgi:S-(hydroxymethyl)glutathione dehydrogenase/alcohol dehydrogenase